jgi:toxin ParE1/3/4
MSLTVILRRKARDEFEEAIDWYDRQRAGLGTEFAERVQDVLDRISTTPELYPVIHRGTRKALVRQFPYSVYYRVRTDRIVVVAVFNNKRNPDAWKSRG